MNTIHKIGVIGLGLLGGSMALALKKAFGVYVLGVDTNRTHLETAKKLKIIDKKAEIEHLSSCDVVIIAVPVDKIPKVLTQVLHSINANTLVFDVGSTKHNICKSVARHPRRGNYVATHPIAGTEFSGPESAFSLLFNNKKNIVCDKELSAPKHLETALTIFNTIGLKTDFMESASHDKHIAYVSHLSHISSFMLGKTVLEIEKNEKNIFNMAGSGFDSTVRLAKSSPDTWTPIFLENKSGILTALEEYIRNLQEFKQLIESDKTTEIHQTMKQINYVSSILSDNT